MKAEYILWYVAVFFWGLTFGSALSQNLPWWPTLISTALILLATGNLYYEEQRRKRMYKVVDMTEAEGWKEGEELGPELSADEYAELETKEAEEKDKDEQRH